MIIRKLRLQRAWSQEQLAEFSGLSIRTIQRLEQGQAASLESLKALAAVFEVNVSQLQLEPSMSTTTFPESLPQQPVAQAITPATAQNTAQNPSNTTEVNTEVMAQMPIEEKEALYQIKNERRFYQSLLGTVAIVALLFVINALTFRHTWWVIWPALGMGIGVLFKALKTFKIFDPFGPEWEKRQVEKRLGRKL